MGMPMNDWSGYVADWRKRKGFTTSWSNMMEKLMLVVTEVSEAAEAYRKEDRENFSEEIADCFIRLYDICGSIGIDIEAEIEKKMEKNEGRSIRHGKIC
jgi:NTP pyrophosphatase (non-canonical NTP hydrolase)